METLRTTTPPRIPPNVRPAPNPVRVLIDRERLAKFWFLIAAVVLIAAAWERHRLINAMKREERVVILDPSGTYHISPVMQFQNAHELHAQQSTFATLAFLERNPHDFDQPELLRQLFLAEALAKAKSHRTRQAEEFKAKQLHQKPEIGRIDILETRTDSVLTQVTGQLIRNGIFEGKSFSEAIPFTLKFKMLRNPNLVENGRFPTAVKDFKYE